MTENDEHAEEHQLTLMPIIIAAGVAILLLGLVLFIPLIIAGLAIIAVCVAQGIQRRR